MAFDFKRDWKKIAKKFFERVGKKITASFLRLKYKETKPTYAPKPKFLNNQDDIIILKMVQKYDVDWKRISEEMDNMDPIKIRNRYYSYILKPRNYNALMERI